MSQSEHYSTLPDDERQRRRRRYFTGFAMIVGTVALASAAAWWLTARGIESTDDAYVAGDVVQVSPQIVGTVVAVLVQNTDSVEAGTPLIELDKTDAKIALDAASDQLAHAVREYRSASADAERERAQIRLREAAATRARDDLNRRLALISDGAVADEDVRHARDAASSADAALDAQRAAYQASVAHTDGTSIDSSPLVRSAAAQVRSAALAMRRTVVLAPVAGLVTKRVVEVGQRVVPGTPMFAIVPMDRLWAEANFKESQLRRMHVGQRVQLHADLYGSALTYHGVIEGFEAGTGAAFASVPAQNATGNWIKVVQRLSARIALDPQELRRHPLRIGLSMTAQVRVGGRAGEANAASSPARPVRTLDTTAIFRDDENVGSDVVDQIIRENAVPGAHADQARGAHVPPVM
ncbi:Membrane fusion component of tripartite multidrug resistance system [Paraburkholderia ribeironis]|uniref:Membrane fusion component of tripartite multidrug resistance system n=1 Tax=Paraburkholderia ribeironis TaxID=1247936 RepID=A0A1N7RY68_9BURK|nr:HlyD family efflux transporter periplasmic adaptor subunit [Paraburkholderia ribeironis]SIT40077.1 Membrane fusion component of tripartite multidrug resistance system [Paraburkholderia ribeironis]